MDREAINPRYRLQSESELPFTGSKRYIIGIESAISSNGGGLHVGSGMWAILLELRFGLQSESELASDQSGMKVFFRISNASSRSDQRRVSIRMAILASGVT